MWVYAAGRRMEIPDKELTAGGEGKIHAVPTQPETLAKILFKRYRTDERREKLKALVASPPHDPPSGPDRHRRFAWPRELLFDANNKSQFLGFTMPSIPGGTTLGEFITRGASQFRPDPLFRVGLAIAVARLIAEVHRHCLSIVVGDINEKNFLADAQGRVALIDLDSVQITTLGGQTYLCPVGKGYYTPPELCGKDFTREQRTREHDCFGLAVLIFQSLFEGWHPFDAHNNRKALADRIRDGDWPYTPGAPYPPPPDAPPFSALPGELQGLFVDAFLVGHSNPTQRPKPEKWIDALTRHEKALKAGPAAATPAKQRAGARGRPRGVPVAVAVLAFVTICALGGRSLVGVGVEAARTQPHGEQSAAVTAPAVEVKPEPPQPPRPCLPPRPPQSPWEQVRELEPRWEQEMQNLLNLVEEQQPEALRDPRDAVSACIEQDLHGHSTYFEHLVRHGDATLAGLVQVERTARELCELLEQVRGRCQGPDSSAAGRGLREAVAALRRGEERAEPAALLCRVLRDELALIADLPRQLEEMNGRLRMFSQRPAAAAVNPRRECQWQFSDAICQAVVLRDTIRDTLRKSRARSGLREP